MILRKIFIWGLGLSLASSVFAGHKPRVVTTKVNVFKPRIAPTRVKRGFCWVNSLTVTRPDAWRCMVSNQIFDPCFALKTQDILICNASPIKNSAGFFLRLTDQLPEPSTREVPLINAWIIKLENGQVCRPYTGTFPIVEYKDKGLAIRYGCQTETGENMEGLLEGSIIPGRVWRAKKITYRSTPSESKVIKIRRVKIQEVWQ